MRTEDMKVVTLEGGPRARGRAMGETLREDVRAVAAKRDEALASFRGYEPTDYWAALDRYGRFEEAAQIWAPELLEEVTGLAEGAAIDRETAMRLQYLDEDWFFDAFHYAPRRQEMHKCTAFAVAGNDETPALAGQNMDIAGYANGHQVLLRIRPGNGARESLVFSYAGLLALMGVNDAPLGVTCNTLMQLGSRADGLPVAFVVRRLLAESSFTDAELVIRELPHACGQTYTLSTPGRVDAFECGPRGTAAFGPPPGGGRVVHTNHPLAGQPERPEIEPGANSAARLAAISGAVMHEAPLTLADLKSALSARDDPEHPVCRELPSDKSSGNATFTAGSMIVELTSPPRMHLAAGPPTRSSVLEYRL